MRSTISCTTHIVFRLAPIPAALALHVLLLTPVGLCAQTIAPMESAQGIVTLPAVTITAPHQRTSDTLISDSPAAVGVVTVTKTEEINKAAGATLDDIMQRVGQGAVDARGSFGVISGTSIRGFAVQKLAGVSSSKILINDHPDVADSFNRDMSTVERIEVTGGFDGTLIGAGNPGGIIQFQTKQPRGKDASELSFSIGSDGLKRTVIDAEKGFQNLQLRLVVASQRGQKTVEGVGTDRDNVLLSSMLTTPAGQFRLETEYAKNKAPFVFGTFFANGQFQYDKPYVSPQSTAIRETKRGALYWENKLGDDVFAKAWLQKSVVRRKESLLGFYSPSDDTLADGYYRPITSVYRQQDAGVFLKTTTPILGLKHDFTATASHQTQDLNFNGPESVGDYSINIKNPVWPIDVSTLPLVPYTYQGSKTESGIALADSMRVTDKLQLRLGVRQSKVQIRSSEDATKPDQTTNLTHWTHSEGVAYQYSAEDKWWISRASSFVPVLGVTKDGSILPPQNATQNEIGYLHQTKSYTGSVSVFDIRQVNLPGVDPTNRNFLIPIGTVRSSGVSLFGKVDALEMTWQANTTYQSVRNTRPIRASQGVYVAGVPQVVGALTVSTLDSKKQGIGAWLTAFGASKRSADSQGTLYAAGYVRWDTGLSYQRNAWRLSASLQNLFDLRYIQSLNASDNAWQGARRQLQLGASYHL
jgi:iron complex outermembrane recepter protein